MLEKIGSTVRSHATTIALVATLLCTAGVLSYAFATGTFSNTFSTETNGLPTAKEGMHLIELKDGDSYTLEAGYVAKEIGNRTIRMIAYNGSIPGPLVKVTQGSTVTMHFTNNLDIPMTVHSHGLRLDVKSDGTPGLSQDAVEPGETFTYTLSFPDGGVYWYHPHVREDYAQELGLTGNYLVQPNTYTLPPVNAEDTLIVDDILIEDDAVFPFFKDRVNFAIMGRFGNIMLTNGVTDYSREYQAGDVVRLNITSVANARPFEFTIPGARMKLVASDLSPFEREAFIEKLLMGPSERYVVDVYFPKEGTYTLTHTSHDLALGPMSYKMTWFNVQPRTSGVSTLRTFNTVHRAAWVTKEAAAFSDWLYKKPERTLRLTMDPGKVDFGSSMDQLPCHRMPDGEWMGKCTEAKKEAWLAGLSAEGASMGGEKIHWEDHTFEMNSVTTNKDITWQILDETTDKRNMAIDDWKYAVGDTIKIRIFNDPLSPHPMQHPFHMHGQRMMTLSINGEPVDNKVWKDSILIPVGDTYDIAIEFSNPGVWMAHCHIAEHMHSGMMFNFVVGEQYFAEYDVIQKNGGSHDTHGHN
ncbi:MAG: multicopper oxidase family protein [Candidatus Pacebacteria bacterium]|nr:multicopper oxidase family protein [Candidatus Paceibacterota bacterium]